MINLVFYWKVVPCLLAVALSYSPQLVDEGVIPITPDDVLVDALVSPDGVIPISPVALDRCFTSYPISLYFDNQMVCFGFCTSFCYLFLVPTIVEGFSI